jgi:hypothetical protein
LRLDGEKVFSPGPASGPGLVLESLRLRGHPDSLFIEQAVGHFQDVRPGIGLMVLHFKILNSRRAPAPWPARAATPAVPT